MSDPDAIMNLRTIVAPTLFSLDEFKLRKYSGGTIDLCRQVGITLIDGQASGLTAAQVQQQLLDFLFIHTQPIEDVLIACEKPIEEFHREYVRPFSFSVPISTLLKVSDFIETQLSGVRAAMVDIEPKPPIPGAPPPAEPGNS